MRQMLGGENWRRESHFQSASKNNVTVMDMRGVRAGRAVQTQVREGGRREEANETLSERAGQRKRI